MGYNNICKRCVRVTFPEKKSKRSGSKYKQNITENILACPVGVNSLPTSVVVKPVVHYTLEILFSRVGSYNCTVGFVVCYVLQSCMPGKVI